jgi:type II secretory pathway pseudopilin PulG
MRATRSGFTLVEVVLGAVMMALVASAILGAYVSQLTLNEHARNLAVAVQDANRVIEQIRQENIRDPDAAEPLDPEGDGVVCPEVVPAGVTSWNAWMNAGGAGAPKSLSPDPDINELIVVTCQSHTTPALPCGDADQVGVGEWSVAAGVDSNYDPLQVTVAVCWRHRNRVIGECAWDGAALSANDADGDGVIESPAMLTTLVTCR